MTTESLKEKAFAKYQKRVEFARAEYERDKMPCMERYVNACQKALAEYEKEIKE